MNKTDQNVVNETSPISSHSEPQKKSGKGCLIAVIVLILFAVLSFCGFFGFIMIASSGADTSVADEIVVVDGGLNKAAVINIAGVIYGDQDLSGSSSTGLITPAQVSNDLQRAIDDPSVKVIILNIESPGGEAVASDIIYKKVLEAAEVKPVIAYSASVAASGGYYIAAGADEIMMHPGAITGSIGVIMQTQSLDGLYEKLGIENVTFKSDQFKDNEDLFDGDSSGELEEIYQTLVDDTYDEFVTAIVEGRGMEESVVRELGDGRVYSGRQALENGLIDRLGYYDDLYDRAEVLAGESDLTIVEYNHYDFFSSLFSLESPIGQLTRKSSEESIGVKMYYLISL